MTDIAAAYTPFADALRAGGFGIPADPDEWPAELVAAHVILNNDFFTACAQTARDGGQPVYDNEPAVDAKELREFLTRTGSLPELAKEIERSAADLEAAYLALSDAQRAQRIPVRIRHDDELIVDEPRPLGAMIEDNATDHLSMHLEQLLDLRDD
ncbi:MAG: hypothetical protein ACRDP1_03080 [Nocardioidaceae bacterium]